MANSSRADAFEDDDDDTFDEDTGLDDSFDGDMEALKRACMLTGTNIEAIQPSATTSAAGLDSDSGSDIDDLELVRSIQQRFYLPALAISRPKTRSTRDSDDEDDFETLRAIERRFMQYDTDAMRRNNEKPMQVDGLVCTTSITAEENTYVSVGNRYNGEALGEDFPDSDDAHANSQPLQYFCDRSPGSQRSGVTERHQLEDGNSNLSLTAFNNSSFPESAQAFVAAVKKNRSCQKFIRSKLIHIETRIEENKELRRRFKHLLDFQAACKRRAGKVLSQPKDPRIELISLPKTRASSRISKVVKAADKVNPMYFGPDENSHVVNYKMVLEKFPVSLRRQPWSKVEKENLAKGIKQQFQEMLLRKSIENFSGEVSSGDSNVDSIIASINSFEITQENIRSFLPHVDWERLASTHVMGRSGAECEARWLNCEDPMINHNPWTKLEDKNLLFICQQRGIYNWIEIAASLGTNRTPFQCLARYQRSLNAYILKRDWTEEEDAQLRAVVETVGENDWQRVASILGSRTGPQCSNRWRKTLHPSRKRVGRWTADEDKHLKIAVMLFGQKTWKKIAKFVPGRTQVQCRERWVNTLDPSLCWGPWTEEEDSKLKDAIAKHGYCWSKIAALVAPRTDNQCWRRWKLLFPQEVPLHQAARKIQKIALISNFVDREEQRPALGPSDFVSTSVREKDSHSDAGNEDNNGKRKRKSGKRWKSEKHMNSSNDPQPSSPRELKRRATARGKGTSRKRSNNDTEMSHGDATMTNKSQRKRPPVTKAKKGLPHKSLGTAADDIVMASHGDDNITRKRKRKMPPKAGAKAHSSELLRTSDCDVSKASHGDTTILKKRKKQIPPKVLADCQPAEGRGDQHHSESEVNHGTATEGISQMPLSKKSRSKRETPPTESLDAAEIDALESDDVTLASWLHKHMKRRHGLADDDIIQDPTVEFRQKRGNKKAPKLISDNIDASLKANPRATMDDISQMPLSEKPRHKRKARPKEILDALESDYAMPTYGLCKHGSRCGLPDDDIIRDPSVEFLPQKGGTEKAPKLVCERDSCSQLHEDQENFQCPILGVVETRVTALHGILTPDCTQKDRRMTYEGVADDALLGNGGSVADQVEGTCSMGYNTSLKKHKEKKAHKMAWGGERIQTVANHEALPCLHQAIFHCADTRDLSLHQSEATECSHLGKSVSGEPISFNQELLKRPAGLLENSEMCWVTAGGRSVQHLGYGTVATSLQISESPLNNLEEIETAPADCAQQWAGEESAGESLAGPFSLLDGWDIIEPAKDGDENLNHPPKADYQIGTPCIKFRSTGGLADGT